VKRQVQEMVRKAAVIVLSLGIVGHVSAKGRDVLARFEGGIGVIPAQSPLLPVNADGSFQNVVLNVVRGVRAGSAIWRIADLRADVDTDGRFKVRGRGLLLASGNLIGQTANQSVFATLICEANAPFVERSTAFTGVPLEPDGDFRIDDSLNPAPSECPSPVLLIRSTANGGPWFAAGIPKLGDDDY
jgi:hypothetical protein